MIALMILATLAGLQAQGDPGTAKHLIQHLHSDDIEAREEALRGLKALGESARGALEEATRSSTPFVADSARFLIRRLDVAKRLTSEFIKARPEAVDQLGSEDPHAWTVVLLDSTRWTSKGQSFPTLRRSDVEVLVGPAFHGAATGKEKEELCLLAQNWRLRSAIPEIAKYLQDPDPEIQRDAVYTLGSLEALEYVDAIAQLAASGKLEARMGAAQALVSLGAKDRFPDIMKGLRNSKTFSSSQVVDAIGGLGLREELPFVLAFLERGWAAHSVLTALGNLQAIDQADRVAAYLKNDLHETRSLAAEALGRMGSRKHADAVAELLDEPGISNSVFRSLVALEMIGSPSHLPKVLPHVKNPTFPHVRARAIRVIKSIGGKDRIPDLAAFLKDPDKETRVGAAVALIELNAAEHLPAILKMIADEPDGRNLTANYSNLLRSGAELMRTDGREALVEAYRRHGRSEVQWVRHAALTALTDSGHLDAAGQSTLIADVLNTPVGASSPVQGICLVSALTRIHEPKAWALLNGEVPLPLTVEKADDFKTWLQELGLKVTVEGNLVFQTRLEKGQRASPAHFIDKHAWRPRAIFAEGDSVTLLRWDAALERWAKRLARRP